MAAFTIALGFILVGQISKAKFIILVRWHVLFGFLMAKKNENS
jgi:hypothetical protein